VNGSVLDFGHCELGRVAYRSSGHLARGGNARCGLEEICPNSNRRAQKPALVGREKSQPVALQLFGTSTHSGSTRNHVTAPSAHRVEAVRNEAVHPKWLAMRGVRTAVRILPVCAPMFTRPDTAPADEPANVDGDGPKRTLGKVSAPAPPANTTMAVPGPLAPAPRAMKTAAAPFLPQQLRIGLSGYPSAG
jgi:hypothetical protein